MADENQSNQSGSPEGNVGSLEQPSTTKESKPPESNKKSGIVEKIKGLNIYMVAFIVVVAIAATVIYIALRGDSSQTQISINDDELTQDIVDELLANETSVGDVNQTLTVEANAIFNGKILVKDSLDVAGSINVGGPLTLPGITVSGSSTFDDVEVGNNLSILGNSSVQGTLSVQNGLTVVGDGTFSGTVSAAAISATDFEFVGDLQFTRHLDSGGSIPSIASGSAVGSGGTVSISGTDTSGTITINTGSGPASGILATITFNKSFNSTPQVVFSAANSNAALLDAYVSRSSTKFTLRTANVPSASSTYIFNFVVIE